MPAPRLIAIDMDGTLLGSDGRVSERNLAALQGAEAAGAEIVIATGRRHGYAMNVLRELELRPEAAIVSSNGTVVRTFEAQLLHRTHMPIETARWLCGYADEFRGSLVLTFDNVKPDGSETRGALVVEQTRELHASIDRWMQTNEPYIEQVGSFEAALESEPPIQAMLCGTVARMRAAQDRLLQHPGVVPVGASGDDYPDATLTLHRTEYPDKDLCILDILPAGCSKASALAHLAGARGLHASDVLALGDNWNDLPMFEYAGRAVVMANAPDDLQELAHQRGWHVGRSNDEDGVACAIEAALH